MEKNFCPTVPGHVLRRMAKSQVPGTQNVRVRACQSPQNQSLAAGKQIGTIQVLKTGLARTISITRPRDLAILVRTCPGTDEQKFFSESNFVKMSVRTFVPSKCPSGRTSKCPNWDLEKFPTKKKMLSESKGHRMKVAPNLMNWEGEKICFELRAHLSPWRQCQNVRTFVPSKCPAGRTFKCPNWDLEKFPTKKKMSSESKGQKIKVAPNFMNWEGKKICFELGAHLGGMAAPY